MPRAGIMRQAEQRAGVADWLSSAGVAAPCPLVGHAMIPGMTGRVSPIGPVSAAGLPASPAVRYAATAGLLAGACATLALAGPAVTAIGPVRRALCPGLAGRGEPGHVALTFDDGPDPASTPQFLELLAARGIRATFFLLGSMVARAPSLAAEISAAGHETAVHGWDHRSLLLRTPGSCRDDIRRAAGIVADATGTAPALFRPPYGVLTTGALRTARDLGLTTLLWGSWGREWAPGATPESVYSTLARTLAGGVTVLLHDSDCTSPPGSSKAALGALPLLLDACAAAGLQPGPAAEHGLW
jgi:peptidoglycan-N-acetylglucosamine deacetylase